MCQPPENTIQGGADAVEAAHSGEPWNSQSSDGSGWPSPTDQHLNVGVPNWGAVEDAALLHHYQGQDSNQGMTSLPLHGQSLFAKYGQQQQQHQQQQRAAQFAAIAAMGANGTQVGSSWAQGLGQNLADKVQRAAAGAGSHKTPEQHHLSASLPWLGRQGMYPAATGAAGLAGPTSAGAVAGGAPGMWSGASAMAVQRPGVPTLAPHLVAQGIPLGMAQFGQMDVLKHQHDDDDDLDPKKYKRMMSNRASAKRSRQRRQERLDELEIVSAKLQVENATVQRRLNEANDRIRKFQEENESLQEELRSLKVLVTSKGGVPTPTPAQSQPDTSPGTMTKQDSCGPNGSTTDNPSDPSSVPSGPVTGKRRRDQAAESRFQGTQEWLAVGGMQQREQQEVAADSPVTPTSGTTAGVGKVVVGAGAGQQLKEGPRDVLLHQDMGGILDEDLFTFLEECFEAKPVDAAALPRP